MSSFENFVQCRVVTPFTAAATEIGLFAAEAPYRLPAEGGGVLVLTDSPYRPSVLEVVRYGRRTGMALYDVSRAQEGTTARDWTGVAFCYQALTAGELQQLLGSKADLDDLDELRQEAETALGGKVDKISGKSLSTNDYTTAEKNKLANANLTALVGLTGAADRLPYFTGAGALSLATITAAARTLLAATNVAGQQSALGLFADASGVLTNASGALTNVVSQLLRSADAAAGRSTLGLGTAATSNVTGSDTDTTAGRLLRTRDHGVGVPANVPARTLSTFEAHSGLPTGAFYRALGAGTEIPTPGAPAGSTSNQLCVLSLSGFGDDAWRHWLASENSGSAAARRLWWGQTHPGGIFWDQILTSINASALPIVGSLSPTADNLRPIGEANKRWSTAHLGTAPIVTSDRDAKQDILPIDDAVLDAWATLDYMQYRLKDAVALKGAAARTHAGLIAQDIREAFEAAGLDPFTYGVLCYDEWEQELLEHPAEYEWITVPAVLDDEGNEVEPGRQEQGELIKEAWTEVVREAGHRYSVRYEEAFALECALQRRTTQRLEQRLAALESAA